MYASLYPSLLREYNIAAHTQIGKINILDDINRVYNKAYLENWTQEIAFMEDMQSNNWIEFCYRWFNLASYSDLYHEVEWIMENIICPVNGLRLYERNGLMNMMIDTPNHPKYKGKALQEVFIENGDEDKTETYYTPNTNLWDSWREEKKSNSYISLDDLNKGGNV